MNSWCVYEFVRVSKNVLSMQGSIATLIPRHTRHASIGTNMFDARQGCVSVSE